MVFHLNDNKFIYFNETFLSFSTTTAHKNFDKKSIYMYMVYKKRETHPTVYKRRNKIKI